jgi:CNT family concentrative nucleoside transporter
MIFAFHILPFIIVMSCLTAILWYWGVLPILVKGFSIVCQKLFNIGGPIGLGGAANVFVGQVEAPLLIRPYLKDLSKKELLILMTTGMATVAGSVMIALVSILDMKFEGINLIQHFLIASILSVPAAIVYANIMIPSNHITDFESSETPRVYESTMDAITRGTSDGMNIALSVGSIVLAFIALVFIADSILGLIPISLGGEDLSLKLILGYMFAPIAWMMGIPWDEALISGKLLGTKTALNEFVAYLDLAALSEGALSDRSRLITLYGLCGFANFSSIGILVAGISAMAPEKKPELIEVSLKALVGATLASCMTGLVLSIFI